LPRLVKLTLVSFSMGGYQARLLNKTSPVHRPEGVPHPLAGII
jgi:hypothetical protein